ncbi:hypothetical protein SBOR_1479 [Sclerotinia borealis F-4128]|uniref:F-box domain-containing protein n=1 Tax=Sclerotinia borealis (strain F-4128) TaxID=1432307 RepID=W9CUA5_SCLBF|nr:hypothetical protein SBOR_1479 [Sclerotinia borealis F-4128]
MDSNPWSLPWPRELPVVVQNLQKLPIEIVHQILSDLPVIKILAILSWRLPFLWQCVLTHINYGRIFRSYDDISDAMNHYTLYREICWFRRWPPADPSSIFALSSQILIKLLVPLHGMICKMRSKIRAGLDIRAYDLDLLIKHGGKFRPGTTNIRLDGLGQTLNLQTCWVYWNWIKESKRQLNITKSEQKRLSARLVGNFSRFLRQSLDPSQGNPRPNTSHIVARFESSAIKSLRDRNLYHNWLHKHCKPGTDLVELVPYDRYLWLLLETLDKHPFDIGITGLEDTLAKVTLHNEEQGTDAENTGLSTVDKENPSRFQYPEEIADELRTVLKGLMYVYTEPPSLVPRIQWAPAGNVSSSEKWPKFSVDRERHPNILSPIKHQCVNKHIKPHDEREYGWLEAFVKAIRWIESNIGVAKGDF